LLDSLLQEIKMLMSAILAASCVKLLYLPSYRSTDFEVHRNWLAVTSNSSISKWYVEDTSPWTLDYPPFFAWFELILSKAAFFFDPDMLKIENLDYSSDKTILFQRLSVIVTDIIFAVGAWRCSLNLKHLKLSNVGGVSKDTVTFLLLMSNFGLFVIDQIHFQYNGFLFGVLLLSISCLMEESFLLGGFWFAVLLNLKHIYVYVAPAYFIYLLRSYCFTSRSKSIALRNFSPVRLIRLGALVIFVFCLSFGPFIHQIEQVVSRLFPFKRGLCHAYWAPNFWAGYNMADKILSIVLKHFGYLDSSFKVASMTGGLVQDIEHAVLPSVPPLATFLLTFASMVPAMVKLWLSPYSFVDFLRCLTMCGWCSFLFGWHVHEKAILIVIIPLALLAVVSKQEAKYFLLLSITGHFSLFPLLFTNQEIFSKIFLFIFSSVLSIKLIKQVHKVDVLTTPEKLYVLLAISVFVYSEWFHAFLGFQDRMPFLPLLLYSLYSAAGVISTAVRFYSFILYQ